MQRLSTGSFGTRMDDEDEPSKPDESGAKDPASQNELESRLLKGRKVMVFGQINDRLARDVVARLLRWPKNPTSRSTSTTIRPVAMSNPVIRSMTPSSSSATTSRSA